MLQDCVGIRADAYKPPVNKFTLKIEKKKKIFSNQSGVVLPKLPEGNSGRKT